jgi:hypothetical protein
MLAACASEAQASLEAAAKIIPVQEMPRPDNLVNADVAKGLASVCPDEQVGALLADGVDPKNEHQEAWVVCTNHKSSTLYHELVRKAHREENEAGRNMFRRPSESFRAW